LLDDVSRALHIAEKPAFRAEGGAANGHAQQAKGFDFFHGLLDSAGYGRTDTLPINVPSGSYVLPADVVSGLGQGNTIAGAKMLDVVFSGMPYQYQGGAYGSRLPEGKKGPGAPDAPAPHTHPGFANPPNPINSAGPSAPPGVPTSGVNLSEPLHPMKKGGSVPYKKVPIIAAGGEYVIHPDIVRYLGGGNMKDGHDFLDSFVRDVRKRTHKTLKSLPGPAKD